MNLVLKKIVIVLELLNTIIICFRARNFVISQPL